MKDDAASFTASLMGFADGALGKERVLFDRVDAHVGKSIKFGSPVTGAPGQPVEYGDLRDSYVREELGDQLVSWASDLVYAPIIEDNLREAVLRSSEGGFHSIKKTRNGYVRVVAHELKLLGPGTEDFRGRGSKVRGAGGRFI